MKVELTDLLTDWIWGMKGRMVPRLFGLSNWKDGFVVHRDRKGCLGQMTHLSQVFWLTVGSMSLELMGTFEGKDVFRSHQQINLHCPIW